MLKVYILCPYSDIGGYVNMKLNISKIEEGGENVHCYYVIFENGVLLIPFKYITS